MKNWYKSKTIWLAVLQGVAGIMTAFLVDNPELAMVGWVATGKSLVDLILRMGTTTEIK